MVRGAQITNCFFILVDIGTGGDHITSVLGMGAKITDGDTVMLILLVKFGRGAHITSVLGMGAKITNGDTVMLILLVKLGREVPILLVFWGGASNH
jgi:hypothetical protein